MQNEKTARSITKAITYRIISIIMDSAIAYLVTKDVGKTLLLVVLTNSISIIIYFSHERVWNKISWGKKTDRE